MALDVLEAGDVTAKWFSKDVRFADAFVAPAGVAQTVTGYVVVRLGPWLRLLPGLEVRAGGAAIPADSPVSLPAGPTTVTVSVTVCLPQGGLDARLGIPVWVEPGGTTTVDLARLALRSVYVAPAKAGVGVPVTRPAASTAPAAI